MALETFSILPADLSWGAVAALMALSFLASALTASFGLGGGIAMLAGLGMVMAPAVLIPIHGCIQLGSNAGRALVLRSRIQAHTVLWFGLGAVPGAFAGGAIAVSLPEAVFQFAIGAFILYALWAPQPDLSGRGPRANLIAGALISALGMITGVSGPLVANFLKKIQDRRALVATQATIMTCANIAKIAVFWLFGFAFVAYLPFIAAMIASGFAGTLAGSRLLARMPEATFRLGFRTILSLMALYILGDALR